MNRPYKIRKFQNGKNSQNKPFINYSLTIPSSIAEQLPEGMTFTCELNNDGILFRPANPDAEAVALPDWAKNGAEAPEKPPAAAKAKPARKRPAPKKDTAKASTNGNGSTTKPKRTRPRPGAAKS